MISVAKSWNSKQARLKEIILKPDAFTETIALLFEMHSLVHTSQMSGTEVITYEDQLWEGLEPVVFSSQVKNTSSTIAWNLWHITRIEDITSNILIAEDSQVISSDNWLEKMKASVLDTGNAMSDREIADFSWKIDMAELKNYRIEVGRKTRHIINSLRPESMKKKVKAEGINRILLEGGVTEAEQSRWLLDFWSKKTIAGIILMPITRHQVVHLNDSFKLKSKLSDR